MMFTVPAAPSVLGLCSSDVSRAWKLYDPPELEAVKAVVKQLHAKMLPNALDLPADLP